MIYTPLTVRAMNIAYSAHHGKYDKGGVPYIFHPMHVAESMTSEYAVCAALLHDVVEDTDVTLADLKKVFHAEVTNAVSLLTHKPGQDYADYLRSVRSDPIALEVKLADIAHNSDFTRLGGTPGQCTRLSQKYAEAVRILNSDE